MWIIIVTRIEVMLPAKPAKQCGAWGGKGGGQTLTTTLSTRRFETVQRNFFRYCSHSSVALFEKLSGAEHASN